MESRCRIDSDRGVQQIPDLWLEKGAMLILLFISGFVLGLSLLLIPS